MTQGLGRPRLLYKSSKSSTNSATPRVKRRLRLRKMQRARLETDIWNQRLKKKKLSCHQNQWSMTVKRNPKKRRVKRTKQVTQIKRKRRIKIKITKPKSTKSMRSLKKMVRLKKPKQML